MGKIKKGVITGLVGNLVFSNWKGRQVIKTRPEKSDKPATINQEKQRNKLSVVNAFLKHIKPVISVGYQESDKISGYNECVSVLLKNAIKLEEGIPIIDYQAITISRGLLIKPEIESVEVIDGKITISWNKSTTNANTKKNDEAFILLFPEEGKPHIFDCIGLRPDGKGTIQIPAAVGSPFHLWMFFSNPRLFPYESKLKVSDSVYLGNF